MVCERCTITPTEPESSQFLGYGLRQKSSRSTNNILCRISSQLFKRKISMLKKKKHISHVSSDVQEGDIIPMES